MEGVSDIALSLDENLKSLYGITIDGTNFTISNEAAYGKEITFTVKYTNSASVAKNSIQSANLKVTVQKAAVTAGVTLKGMRILYELSWLWETLVIALAAAAVCVVCAMLICKAVKKNLSKKTAAVIGAAAFAGAVLAVIVIARTPMPL